jgi:hypothetical protein
MPLVGAAQCTDCHTPCHAILELNLHYAIIMLDSSFPEPYQNTPKFETYRSLMLALSQAIAILQAPTPNLGTLLPSLNLSEYSWLKAQRSII